tara:strand:- start:46490 stop:46786 length:297 start_codon:yes stop_codon:yes gene_type:complete
MSQTVENNAKTPICKQSEALISLLTNYSKEDVNYAFTENQKIFNEWLEGEYADNQEKRRSALYSVQILSELGTIIQGISPKKIKKLYKQMQSFKKEIA